MKKMRATIIVGLGASLLAFQNCGSGMEASQTIENMQAMANRQDDNNYVHEALVKNPVLPRPGTCLTTDMKFPWPLGGAMYHDWNIVNYNDDDPATTNLLDYFGAVNSSALTYDAHAGVDIEVPDFRYMDNNFPIFAAWGGIVVDTSDGSFDRNLACSTDLWNHVTIKHPNGFLTIYGHMKNGSVAVKVGDVVTVGQKLGVVGSSGCSTYPHLHFEVLDCSNNIVDPMKFNMFQAPPIYSRQAPTSLMQTVVKQPVMTTIAQMADPGLDTAQIKINTQFSLAMTLANLKPGDIYGFAVFDTSGAQRPLGFKNSASTYYQVSHWWVNTAFDQAGVWTVKATINGVVQGTKTITVVP